jgi:NAD(P)-dependent dehydrogenase (short-subunit alcohol dehydrogenase family)
MDLKGKTAVVTGGNSGIGLASATALAQAGSRIVVGARGQKRKLMMERFVAAKKCQHV